MDEREVLRCAAEYIAERGWHQGAAWDWDDEVDRGRRESWLLSARPAACALGAMALGTGELLSFDHPLVVSARARLSSFIGTDSGEIGTLSGIPQWNDAPERTAEEVILAMKKAAER